MEQGKDAFVFDTKLNKSTNVDKIADFKSVDDTLYLNNAVLKKVGSNGKLKTDAFILGNQAKDAEDRIIYDKTKGVPYYDADGTGKGASVAFAAMSKNLALTNKDFFVI